MTLVPGGAFRMGSTGFYPEEGPVTAAEVESLWVDDHPVTNAAFRRFVAFARPSAAKSRHPAEAKEMPRV
jgi:formylglycine-generating enzyme required for sulfatase activity